jgi:hypothetical protein
MICNNIYKRNNKMRKMGWLLIAALLCSPVSVWAGQQDFILVNNSGKALNSVYVSDHNISSWEEDILGRDILSSGYFMRIHFNTRERSCFYDMRVNYVGGGNDQWPNINLCIVTTITFRRDDYVMFNQLRNKFFNDRTGSKYSGLLCLFNPFLKS